MAETVAGASGGAGAALPRFLVRSFHFRLDVDTRWPYRKRFTFARSTISSPRPLSTALSR